MAIPAEQYEAKRFLAGLAHAAPVETHVSAVFVGADTAWKIKKAVKLPYLDFRTLESRRRVLVRELALNRAAAPDIYRDVAALVRDRDGRLALVERGDLTGDLAAPGEAVEWVLRMARIPSADFFDRIAEEGRLVPALARRLGRAIACYHGRLPPLSGIDHAASLQRLVDETERSACVAGFAREDVLRWKARAQDALASRADWLRTRSEEGFVRRAHGDLHLRNICLWHGKPIPFDALEFDERLASIDLGFDLAFLLMDCDLRVGRAIANAILMSYIATNGDVALVGGLVPFLSLRAITRAHVERIGGDAEAGQRYFKAASRYLVPRPAALVAIGGLPGAGKSTLAHRLAPMVGAAPGALILSSDLTRKRVCGVPPETRLPSKGYTEEVSRRVDAELMSAGSLVLSLGHSVILDATFLGPSWREHVGRVATEAGVPFLGLWLEAPLTVLEERISARSRQPEPDPSDATVAVLHRFAYAAHDPDERWHRLPALSPEDTLARACQLARREIGASLGPSSEPRGC